MDCSGLVASKIVHEYESKKQHQEMDCGDITSAIRRTKNVVMTDFNKKVLINLDRNIALNELNTIASTMPLDFYAQNGTLFEGGWTTMREESCDTQNENESEPAVDLILAADVICKPSDSVAVTKTIYDVLKPGGEAIIVSADAKHRFGVDIFEQECKKVGLHITVIDVASLCGGKLLPQSEENADPCGIRQTSGFVDGMSLTMFRVFKSMSVSIPS